MPLGGLLGGLLGHLCVQTVPWRHLESAQNHVFYKGFLHFRVLGIFASKNAALRALGGDLGGLGSLLGAPWGLLGASWGRPGASWGRLGGVLGRLGASWARLGRVLGPFLVPKKRLGGLLGPIFWAAAFFAVRRAKNLVKTMVFEHFWET